MLMKIGFSIVSKTMLNNEISFADKSLKSYWMVLYVESILKQIWSCVNFDDFALNIAGRFRIWEQKYVFLQNMTYIFVKM